jgi:hypothetical protein
MKWLKRTLWVAAWGVWVWCGFGLARELPRDLGPVLTRLQLTKNESVIGILSGGDIVITKDQEYLDGHFQFRARALADGRVVCALGPFPSIVWPRSNQISFRHGYCVHGPPMPQRFAANDLWSTDLRTGAKRSLAKGCKQPLDFHPTLPVAALATGWGHASRPSVVFCNLETGEEVGRWDEKAETGEGETYAFGGFFLDDSSEFLIVLDHKQRSTGTT